MAPTRLKQEGAHAPPTQPLCPPSLSTGEVQNLRPNVSSPAHWSTSVQAPPAGVPPLTPASRTQLPAAQVLLSGKQLWQKLPLRPHDCTEVPDWQRPDESQQPAQFPGLH